jgi:hypothetical protein
MRFLLGVTFAAFAVACSDGASSVTPPPDAAANDGASGSDASGSDASGDASPDAARPDGGAVQGDEFAGATTSLSDLFPQLHDVATVAGGKLTLQPVVTQHTHWYSDSHAPFVYLSVTGDFVAETDVVVGRRTDVALPPRGTFSAGGLLVRDPAAAAPGNESWIMYNIGMQTGAAAREAKTTRKGAPDSLSTLYLIPTGGVLTAKLRVCRIGATFRMYHRMPNESAFVEEAYGNGTAPQGNGAGEATPGVVPNGVIAFARPDLPATLQVGLLAGHWEQTLETRAEFDYLRVRPVAAPADCTAP